MGKLMASGLDYNLSGGQLPFAAGGNPVQGMAGVAAGLGIPGMQGLADQYGKSYQAALQQNQALYQNILGGYQKLLGNQQAAQQPIAQGYQDLQSSVLGGIANVGASQKQALADTYAQRSGGLQQAMVNSGLGNTTVTGSMQRGVNLDESKAQVALSNQMAQLTAGYQSNLGLAGLNYANQANMQNSALGQSQLNWENSITAQYPDPGHFNALFGQAGQFHQMGQDRALQYAMMGQRRGFGGGGGGSGAGAGAITYGQRNGAPADLFGRMGGGNYGTGGGYGGGGGGPSFIGQMPGLGGGSMGSLDMSGGGYGGGGNADPYLVANTLAGIDNGGASQGDWNSPWGGGLAGGPMDNGSPIPGYMDPSQGGDFSGGGSFDNSSMPVGDFGGGGQQLYAMGPQAMDPTMSGQGADWSSGYGLGGDTSGGGAYGGDYSGLMA